MEKLLIIGSGGHALSVLDAVEAAGQFAVAGFVDTAEKSDFSYRGYRVIGQDEQLADLYRSGIRHAAMGIGFLGKGTLRNRLYATLKAIGFSLPPVVDPTAVLAADATLGEGVFVGKRAVVNAAARVDTLAIVNTGAIVEHDCRVGEFSHVAVGAVLCGAVQVGRQSLIGAGATLLQTVEVGDHSIIAAGAIVPRSVGSHVLYKTKLTVEETPQF